ncbi:MAG: hypothetical protein JXR64_13665, partial [Spirochaetales bacterium]|nr:hypothetical protein [Spirochaetales bacterium]
MLHFSKRVLLCLYIILTFSLYSQNLFWAEKEVLSDGISFFSTFKSSDEYIYSVWQEVNYFPGNYGGLSSLKIKKSRDGYTWENIPHNIKPVEFYGQTPIQNYSIDCNREGELILAYAHGEAGSYNNIDIYQINSDFNNLEYKNTIKYDKAVLQPTIYYRGSGEDLNLILFVSSLKEFISDNNSSTQLETGALSIFSTTSKDGINWSDTTEFINSTSDQSFLPVYTFYNNKEYVIYQSVLTSSNQSNNFQLYIKSKNINDEDWSQDLLLTNFDEFVTGSGSQNYKEFDNQRVSFTLRNGQLGITWERSFGYEASKIYYGNLIEVNNTIELVNRERITNGSRSCSRPTGFEFNNEFMLMWFDNQLGSNDIVMATLDKQSGLWIEKIISDDREYYSVFGQFLQFKNSLRIYWEDQTINRDDVTTTRARILALNPDRDVDSPFITSNYKKRDNKNLIKLSWNRPKDSSGIKSFHYTWSNNEGEIVYEKSVLSTILVSDYLEAINDGEYIFTLVAEDNAGNISNKRIFNYYYDKTPPNKVDFPELKTDEKGFLLSNSESIEWSSLDDDVEGFSYKLSYLGENYAPGDFNINTISLSSVFSNMISVSFSNIDNGYYALVVRAIDSAGNIGNPEAVIFKVNKYIPITYISYINYSQNDTGELVTTINGRGFKDGGDVSVVILDMDGIEPYDYYFENDPNVFRVATDRRIEGPNLDEIEGGTYRVGIIHPLRGLFFSKPIIKVESTGTVKFGDFTVGYEEVWENVVNDKIVITFEFLIFIIILISSIFITFFTTIRLISTIKESKRMYHDAKALAKGTLFLNEKDILRIRNMKKQGFGLRLKFTILIITLIIGVIALISLPLASFMIETQKKNLTEGLRQRTEILLNSISTGAKDYIQIKDVLALDNLIKTTDAMDDVLWASIVGVSETDSKITDALWAYTDTKKVGYYIPLPNEISISDYNEYLSDDLSSNLEIFNRVYTFSNRYILNSDISLEDDLAIRKVLTDSGFSRDIVLGQTRYKDEVYNEITELISNIEEKGNLELSDKKDELSRIQAERSKATGARAQELSDIINLLESQINQALKIMSSGTGQLPNVDYQEIENIDSILFYKPIL